MKTCPACGGKAQRYEGQRLLVCVGRLIPGNPTDRPTYGEPCGFQAIEPLGCCSGGRLVTDPGKTERSGT